MAERTRGQAGRWRVVAAEELRDLWAAGRATWMVFVLALILSVSTVALARTVSVNLLDARAGAVAIARLAAGVGAVLAMLMASDAISGERERATLEALLVTPVDRRQLVAGKLVAALSLSVGCYLVSVPYLIVIGRVAGITGAAVVAAGIVGGLAAVFLAAVALMISVRASTNRTSLAASLLTLAVLTLPGLLPATAMKGAIGQAITRIDPISALLGFLNAVLVDERPLAAEAGWLLSPVLLAAATVIWVTAIPRRIPLDPGHA
ncbi:MAG: ABC transporter permease [Egibacteraceae bacterium]